jgi:hypothetical protein
MIVVLVLHQLFSRIVARRADLPPGLPYFPNEPSTKGLIVQTASPKLLYNYLARFMQYKWLVDGSFGLPNMPPIVRTK